jgi:polysaccharide export outer membrane protein
VFSVADRVRNRIAVEGHVFQPGPQGLTPGMRLSEALRRAGLKSDTYLGEVLVSRLRPDSSRVQLRATLADTTGAVVNDFALQEDDQITVFSLTTFRPARYVSIGGAVRRSGRVLYREGMTVRDLVLLANGVTEGAYLNEAEIARLPEDRSNICSSVMRKAGTSGRQGCRCRRAGCPRFHSSRTTTSSSCANPTGACSAW